MTKFFSLFRLAGVKAPEGALRAPSRHGRRARVRRWFSLGFLTVFRRVSDGFLDAVFFLFVVVEFVMIFGMLRYQDLFIYFSNKRVFRRL